MGKISKKDQDPNQVHKDHEGIQKIMSKKSRHFALGTWVVRNRVRGEILGITGSTLIVRWEDGTTSDIRNPRSF